MNATPSVGILAEPDKRGRKPVIEDPAADTTMKSGTSTLADLLNQSQNIYLPEDELHFFNNKYGFGFNWYENELNKGIPLFKKKESLLIGEKTPTYSYKKECAQKIFNYSKD